MTRLEGADPAAATNEARKDGAAKDAVPNVDGISGSRSLIPKRERPIDWTRIAGYERQRTWEGLAAFVEAMVRHHDLEAVIMACWWRHPNAVENLTALWHRHENTYGEDGKPENAMDYVDSLYKLD